MHVQKIGGIEVRKVTETDKSEFGPTRLFPTVDLNFVKEQRSWLGPQLIEPAELKLYLSFHSYVVKTRHHTILVDTCWGNHKPRPSMPAFSNMQTPYLENLAAIGIRPEDVDYVMYTLTTSVEHPFVGSDLPSREIHHVARRIRPSAETASIES